MLVGRQAILDHKGRTVAYELLYRPLEDGVVLGDDAATARVLVDGVLGLGLETLTDGRPAYVNVPEGLLVSDQLHQFDPQQLVVEVLENTSDSRDVRRALRTLRERGFRVALDDMVADDPRQGLLPLADVAKIDLAATTAPQRGELVALCREHGTDVLYEKVEDDEQAEEADQHRVELLQGYYFARPQVVYGRDVKAMDTQRAQLLVEINRAEPNLAVVEQLIRTDLYLAERFLRLVNAAAFGWRQRIESIGHALVLMGREAVRRWLSLVVLAAASGGKPSELVVLGAARARLLEDLADRVGLTGRKLDLFAGGMFSILDAVLDQPLAEAIAGLPLAEDVRAGMLGCDNVIGRLLRLAVGLERGEWPAVEQTARALALPLDVVGAVHTAALRWSRPTMQL